MAIVRKTFLPGEDLFIEGQQGTEAYLIRSGHVAIWRTDNGTRVNIAVRAEGEVVGEMALIDDAVRSATVTAESRVEAETITRQQLLDLVDKAEEPLSRILHQLFESLRAANDLISAYASQISRITPGAKHS
ncbi:MAG: cyclic nucleotide-binding domain-containing protein [Lentisphaerales bacterium]|nr:MAG: cyclic nucleotide-binding domain-containing protein [Lentisphaerales bacterium]